MHLYGQQFSGDGRFDFRVRVEQIEPIGKTDNYAAIIVGVLDRKNNDQDVISRYDQFHEFHGPHVNDAIRKAMAEAERVTGSSEDDIQ
jgi:hypothetical protein